MDISKSSAVAELRGLELLRRRRAPPAYGADITQVMAWADNHLAEEGREGRTSKPDSTRALTIAVRLKDAGLRACRGVWRFLEVLGQARARRDMLEVANSIASSRPQLAAQLRRAARQVYAE